MPVKKKDTDRALVLLEAYCKKLRKPEEQQLKKAIRKVMGIFKSSLFQALLASQRKQPDMESSPTLHCLRLLHAMSLDA